MNNIKNTKTIIFLVVITILIIFTRGHNSWLASSIHLPDFTIPALLITGVYFRNWKIALYLITLALVIDNYAIIHQGVSASCITPAYSVLLLVYYLVFLSGRYINSLSVNSINSFFKVFSFIVVVTSLEWLIATTSYYSFTNSDWSNFISYALKWYVIEITAVLKWMVAVVSVFSINHYYKFITFNTPIKS